MTTLKVENLSDLIKDGNDWGQAFRMLNDHWKETATFKHLMKLNPDLNRYMQLEHENRLHLVVMRQDGLIVGYSLHVLANGLLHYKHLKTADDDVHYLAPHLRGTGEHVRLRCFALESLRERGVQIVTARSRIGHLHDKSLKAMGFEPWDMVYALDLTKWESPVEA